MNERDPVARQQLATALQPARQRIEAASRGVRMQRAWATATCVFPQFAAFVAIGTVAFGMLWSMPWWLPATVALLLLLFGFLVAHRASEHRVVTLGDGALACDRAHGNQDRLATACELAAAPAAAAVDLPEALAHAAIEDGVASLQRIDTSRLLLPEGTRRAAPWSAFACLLGLLALPLVLPGPGDAAGPDASRASTTQHGERGEADARAAAPAPGATPELPPAAPGERAGERRDNLAKSGSPPPPPKADPVPAVPAASGQGQSGSDAASDSSQTGAPKTAPAGKAASAQAGGGAGSAASGAPEPQQDEKSGRAPQPPKKPQPQKPQPQQDGKPSESAGAPSGPSRGSGRMAAVGNKRNDQNRGLEREDDPEVEDDAVEDESEEQEQRGGVMPMRRGDNRPAARELSISGDGPPDQGRGGPTPPKKARGTASLVLGLRLPDSVRGQPNPGTAKTSLEQIPPRPNTADPGLAHAPGTGRAATPQSPRHPDASTPWLQAYHRWLAQLDAPPSPPAPSSRPR